MSAGGSKTQTSSPAWAAKVFSRTLQDPDGGLFTLAHREPCPLFRQSAGKLEPKSRGSGDRSSAVPRMPARHRCCG
ncbi:hypothetical protein AB0E82_14965 [Streptomyces anulatus]|uniref:hypothetical protein n=1 Tax=Streptomyces anulatus TaxID=1892 RepID=UPI0033E301A4